MFMTPRGLKPNACELLSVKYKQEQAVAFTLIRQHTAQNGIRSGQGCQEEFLLQAALTSS